MMKRFGSFSGIICLCLALIRVTVVNSQHFVPVWGDQNPQVWMNIVVTSASIDGVGINVNDEIAVFDIDSGSGEYVCVGSTVLSGDTGPFFINAGQDDGDGGFTEGNPIVFRLWDSSRSTEVTLTDVTFDLTPPLADVYTANGLASASVSGFTFNTWFGTVDSDWNNPSNWDTGLLPDNGTDVILPSVGVNHYPALTISSVGTCKNIKLESNASGSASILGNEHLTISGNAIIQTYITADAWHIVSKPVDGLNVGFFSLGGDPKVYLTEYNEASETYDYLTDPSLPLNTMQGYMLWVCDYDHVYEYTGIMNYGAYGSPDNLSCNSGESGDEGWNMVGNPYPSSIDWDATSGWTRSANLGSAIYLYNDGIWEYYLDDSPSGHSSNGSRYIAPGQGFFVRVLNGSTGTLIMDDDVRVNNPTQFFKSTQNSVPFAKLAAEGNGFKDETIIRFIDGSSNEFDGDYDVFKKFSPIEDYPQLYTKMDEVYAINSIPAIDQVQLCFVAGASGFYTISLEDWDEITDIWLEDTFSGDYVNLTSSPYEFNYQTEDSPERFIVHFTPVNVNTTEPESIKVFSYNDRIYIQSQEPIYGQISVFNMLGQLIEHNKLSSGSFDIKMKGKGQFIIRINLENSMLTKKVILN